MKHSFLFALAVTTLALPSCTDSSAQTAQAAPTGWGACSAGSGGGSTDRAEIIYASDGDAYHVDFEIVVVGREVEDVSPDYRPAAFQMTGGRGVSGGSMGRWMVGVDREGLLWLHDRSYHRDGANLFLVEPAEAPDSGLVIVDALTRDLSWDLAPCGPIDSLMNSLNRDDRVLEFVGGPMSPRR